VEIHKAHAAAIATANAHLQTLFGAEVIAKLEDLRGLEHYRHSIREIGDAMGAEGVPLTEQQKDSLAQTKWDLWKIEQDPNAKAMKQVADPDTGLTGEDLALLQKSSAFLTAAQQVVLKDHLIYLRVIVNSRA